MLKKIWNSAKDGGLGYFLGSVIVFSVSFLVKLASSKMENPAAGYVVWIVSVVLSILITIPFLTWFFGLTKKWGWQLKLIETGREVFIVFCWSLFGSVVGAVFWYFAYLQF